MKTKQLPKGWKDEELGEIGKFKRGPFGGSLKKEIFVPSGCLVYEQYHPINNDFSFGRYYITKEKFEEMKAFVVKPGDLLISCSGTIGRIAEIPKDNFREGIINQALLKITLDEKKINKKYFLYFFQSDYIQKYLTRVSRGVAIKNVPSVKELKQIKFPLPSLPIQTQIVQAIETQFSRLDESINSLKAVKKKLEVYSKAVLKKAFENIEFGSFESFVDILDSDRVPVNATERKKRMGKVPYYGATGQVGWIDDYLFNEELVLLGEDGAPFLDLYKNKAYLISGKSWVNNHAHVLKGKNGLRNKVLLHWLNIFDYHKFVGGTTRLKLNQSSMKKMPIPKINGSEQEKIVEEIESKFSVIDNVEQVIKQALLKSEQLRKSILKTAFEGKLVKPMEIKN